MKVDKSYVKDTNHFLEKLKELGKVPANATLVTADVVGLYPSILHVAGLKAWHKKLEERNDESVPTADLVNMADFILKNNYCEFNSCIKQQISGTAIRTKFTPPFACVFMDKVESAFFESENTKPRVWIRYIDIFFIWTGSEDELEGFLQCLNTFHPYLKFTHDKSKVSINFLDAKLVLLVRSLKLIFIVSPLIVINFLSLTQRITKKRLCIAKGCVLKDTI